MALQDFKPVTVDVRPAVCVTVPEASTIITIAVVKGEELARMPQIVGAHTAFPGKWYCVSVSALGRTMRVSVASGEHSSVTEAEAMAQRIAREMGQRIHQKVFENQLRGANLGGKQ